MVNIIHHSPIFVASAVICIVLFGTSLRPVYTVFLHRFMYEAGPSLHIQLCIFRNFALWLEYITELSEKMIQIFMVQRIAYLFADLAGVNQAGFRQNLHVVGQSWLSYLEFFKNIGCATFMVGKHIDNAKSFWISDRFQTFSGNGIKFFHSLNPPKTFPNVF